MSSFIINSPNLSLEVPEMALDGQWGMLHSYMTNPHPLEIEKENTVIEETVEEQANILPGNKGMMMDTLSEFYQLYIESEEERQDPLQEVKTREMEKAVAKTCLSVGHSLEAYYQRIAKAYNDILKSRLTKSFYSLKPSLNIYDISKPMREIALAPWKIKELPGRSPSTQWPTSLDDLNERMRKLEPMSAWSEPLFSNDDKDIYEQAEEFIFQTVEKKKKLAKSGGKPDELKKIDEVLSSAVSALIGFSVLSADYTKILSTLFIIYEISENYPDADNIISSVQNTMIHYINELKSIHTETKGYHHLAQGSIYGSILLPKEAAADYQNDSTSSLTTDGTYLYIYWCSGRGGMFKIGTGEGNSLAGKVYLHVRTELTGSVSWVYLNNKLYARRVDEALGVVNIISPDTFAMEGTVSLHCDDKDILSNASSARFNKKYPLLTDGQFLYIIVMRVCSVERKLKDKHKEEVENLQSKEKEDKKKSEETKKNDDKSQENTNEPKPEDPKVSLIAKKGEMLFGKSPAANPDPNAPAKNPEGSESLLKTVQSLKEAKLCEFYLLEFDTDIEKHQKIEKSAYKDNADVQELYESFSCFFSHEDCYRALKMNSDDIQAAATWLVEEGNQDCKNTLIARRKVLLAQSEVINDKINTRNEQDIQVKDDSILFPYDIVDSPWTMNNGQVTLNKYYRNEVSTKVFSVSEEDVKNYTSEETKVQADPNFKRKKSMRRRDSNASGDSCEEEELKSPDLKRSNYGGSNIEGQPPVPSTNYDAALNMYEKLELKGSYLKSINDIKLLDYDMCLSYDHTYNKFYGLVSSQNTKVVLVAQDMSKMRDTTFTTEEDVKNIGIPDIDSTSGNKQNLKSLVHKALEFFMNFERIRFELPWRWRRWSTVFSSASDVSVIKDSKITKRFEKVRDHELNEWRKKFGLEQLIISGKTKKDKKAKPQQPQPMPTPSYYTKVSSPTLPPSEKFKEVPIRIEERKVYTFCVSGDVKTLNLLFKFLVKAFNNIKSELNTNREESKEATEDDVGLQTVFVLLKQLAYWIRSSDTLVASPTEGNPQLLDEIGKFLLETATSNIGSKIPERLDELYRLLWVVMVNGFELFYRSTESQFKFVETLLSYSVKFKKISSSSKNSVAQYHYYRDCFNTNLSPIQLFFMCYFKYPQTFLFRAPLVSSEIKEYSVKFKLKGETKSQDNSKPYTNRFMQKQQQFFNLISMGGVLECRLNEIVEEYKRVEEHNSHTLHLESIQEIQTCSSVSQKDFCAPFTMFFLLDQKIDFAASKDKEKKTENSKELDINDDKEKEEKVPDEETEQVEDYVVDLYLALYQNKTPSQILHDNGYHPQKIVEKVKQEKPKGNHKKRKSKKDKLEEDVKVDEETEKKKQEEVDRIEKENKQAKRQILREVHAKERELHAERVQALWDGFTGIILNHLQQAREVGNLESSKVTEDIRETMNSLNNIRYVWKIFNRLIEDALAVKFATFHNTEKNKEFIIKAVKFAETCMTEFTNKQIAEFNQYEWKWLRCFFKYFQIVSTQCVTDLKQLDFATKVLPTYMKIISMMNKFLGVYNEDNVKLIVPSDDDFKDQKNLPLISNFSVGGIDYTNEKIFETPHPYPRGDLSLKETYYFSKAIAVQIRFDQRCQSDSSNCIIQVSTNDHSFWFNDNFGTQYRSSGKPHNKNPIILMPGNRVSIEFRASAQGGRRKHDLQGDEMVDRYGFRIAVNAIYAETNLGSSENLTSVFGKRSKSNKAKAKDVSNWISLLNSLVHGASVMSQAMIKGTVSTKAPNSVVTWNLLGGGICPGALDEDSHNPIAEYVSDLRDEVGTAYKVCEAIRKLAPKFETKLPPLLKAKFNEEMEKKWNFMINLSMICLMYHADIIEDAVDYVESQDDNDPDRANCEEKLKVVWKYTNSIIRWVQNSLQGEKEIQIIIRESLKLAEDIIKDKYEAIENKWKEAQEKKRKEAEDRKLREEEEKKKVEEAKAKLADAPSSDAKAGDKSAPSSAKIKVSVSKDTNKAKKRNRKKLVNQVILTKNKKKGGKGADKEEKKEEVEVEEDKKEEEKPKEEEKKPEGPPEITDKELIELNNQIYQDIYTLVLSKLKETQLLKTLCARYSIKLDELETKPAIRQICRVIIKERMKPLIDFKKPKELRNKLKFDFGEQESPEIVIIKEIEEKVKFLLEVNPSIDLSSRILEGEKQDALGERVKSSKELNLVKSSEEYSAFRDGSDSGIIMQRSKSAILSPLNKNQIGHSKNKRLGRVSKFSRVGNYTSRNREIKEKEESQSSSFNSVVAFVTNSNIRNLASIKENIDEHYQTADNRLEGFKYYNKLLKMIRGTNQTRSIVSPLVVGVGANPYNSIEASGIERLKKITNRIKDTLKHCIVIFTRDYNKLKQTVSDFIKARQPQQGSQKPTVPKTSSADELIIVSQIRALLECLNDMIIILSENPAKEAFILHIVIEFTKSDTDFNEFLTNLIGLILDTKDSLIVLNKSQISESLISETQTAAKLLLNKFIIKETEDSQISLDAHNLLQETLLEIIVQMLKEEMQKETGDANTGEEEEKGPKNLIQKFLATKYQRLVTLFLLLRSILNMSRCQENLKDEIKNNLLDLVSECISTEVHFESPIQEERSFSTRVIRAACQVAKLCLDKNKVVRQFGKSKNESFIQVVLKKIGQCLTVSDDRSQAALEYFINPIEGSENVVEEEKKEMQEIEKDTKLANDPALNSEANASEDYFYVYASINNSSDDCSFLVTALFELDKLWNLSKDETQKQDGPAQPTMMKIDSSGQITGPPKEEGKTEEEKKNADSKIIQSKTGLDRLIKFAKEIQNSLKNRGTTKIAVKNKMTLKEAELVAQIFYKAYDGDIPPLQINQETLNVLKQSKYLSGIDVVQSYPELFNNSQINTYKAAPQPGQGPLIKLSRDQLQMTICKHINGSNIKIDSASKKLISHRKFCIDNNSRRLVRTGHSSALIIEDLKALIRELLFDDYNFDLHPESEIFTEMNKLLTDSLNEIIKSTKDKETSSDADKINLLYGTLEVVAGLIKIIQPGSEVKMNLNDKECVGTIVDGGYYSGKLDLSVIIDDENNITKLTRDQAKEAKLFESYNRIEWRKELLPPPTLVNEAIVGCFQAIKEGDTAYQTNRTESMRLLLLMLLKISLLYNSDDFDISKLNTIEPLLNICDDYHSKAIEIPSEECELEL